MKRGREAKLSAANVELDFSSSLKHLTWTKLPQAGWLRNVRAQAMNVLELDEVT